MQSTNKSNVGKGLLYVVSAPSGGGKTTLINALMAQDSRITRAVTHTTRAPRDGEENGIHYHFVDVSEFEKLIGEGAFLEYAEVFGNFYGTSLKEVEKHTTTGKDVVLVIDWQGAASVKKLMPEAELIFILPPSIEALAKRLNDRQQDSAEVVAKRMQDAVNQMQHYDKFDYVVINDQFEIALKDMAQIFAVNRLRTSYQKMQNQQLLVDLLEEKR